MENIEKREIELWFALCCGVRNRDFRGLLDEYESVYNIFDADEREVWSMPCSDTVKTFRGIIHSRI